MVIASVMKFMKWTAVLFGVIVFNLFILECLLRVYGLYQNSYESQIDKELKRADKIFDFSPNMEDRLINLGLENKFDLDYHGKSKRIPYNKITDYNPYPPILHFFDSSYVIYNKDFKLKQLIVLSGESDATPSILVEKARGEQTGYGDHFVTYIFYIDEMSGIGFDFRKINWYSWQGRSYDGFEELWIVPLTIVELLIIVILTLLKRRKKAITMAKKS